MFLKKSKQNPQQMKTTAALIVGRWGDCFPVEQGRWQGHLPSVTTSQLLQTSGHWVVVLRGAAGMTHFSRRGSTGLQSANPQYTCGDPCRAYKSGSAPWSSPGVGVSEDAPPSIHTCTSHRVSAAISSVNNCSWTPILNGQERRFHFRLLIQNPAAVVTFI